jgi:hypothetical protein
MITGRGADITIALEYIGGVAVFSYKLTFQ